MALSQEVLDMISFEVQMGYDKLNQFPPAQTREMMKQAPANPNPFAFGRNKEPGTIAWHSLSKLILKQYQFHSRLICKRERFSSCSSATYYIHINPVSVTYC